MTKNEDMLDGVIKALEREYDLLKTQENVQNGWIIAIPSLSLAFAIVFLTVFSPNTTDEVIMNVLMFLTVAAFLIFALRSITKKITMFSERIEIINVCLQLLSLSKLKFDNKFSEKQKQIVEKIVDDIISNKREDAIEDKKYKAFLEGMRNDIRKFYAL